MEYIQGEKFRSLSDDKNIFYCNTHDVDNFFKNKCPKTDFVLISHNSDGGIFDTKRRWCDADFSLCPPNLKKWFGQNVGYSHKKIQSLPIGLENSEWFVQDHKIYKLKEIVKIDKDIKNLVYLNLNIETNHTERGYIYSLANGINHISIQYGRNGMNYDNYLYNLYNHVFMICPPGNGIDVHQPWESMYINTIPIQKKSVNTLYYTDLPICYVDDWEQIRDEEFLTKEYIRIKSIKWNLEKLDFSYWKNLILNETLKI
jgi:hypothetical protein